MGRRDDEELFLFFDEDSLCLFHLGISITFTRI